MRTGTNTKYSHTLAETVRVLRSIPQLSHLRGHFFILLGQLCEEEEPWIQEGMKTRLGEIECPLGLPYGGGWFGDRDAPNADIEYFNIREILKRFCCVPLTRCPMCKEQRHNLRFYGRAMRFHTDRPYCLNCSHQFHRFCSRADMTDCYYAKDETHEFAETLWLAHVVATQPKWAMKDKRMRA